MELRQIVRDQKLINYNLCSLIKEVSDYEEYVSQEMPGIGNKKVRISSVLNYKGDKDFNTHPKKAQLYQQALYNLQQGIEDGSVKLSSVPEEFRKEGLKRKSPEPKKDKTAEPEEPEITQADDDSDVTTDVKQHTAAPADGDEKDDAAEKAREDEKTGKAPEIPAGVETEEEIEVDLDYLELATGKNKRLEKTDFKNSEVWTDTNIEPDDDTFNGWAEGKGRARPDDQRIVMAEVLKASGIDPKDANFPQKYFKVLERLINTKPGPNPKSDSISDFIKGAGAGMLSSQAGEILTMMLTTMPDEQAEVFSLQVIEVLDRQEGNQILDDSWVKAAMANRQAAINHIKSKYGPDAKITGGCWDVKSEVETMGLSDYDKNKGYSTDAYFTVETPQYDGPLLLESSLKKDKNVIFFNGGTTDILKPKCISGPGDPEGCSNMGWGLTVEQFVDLENPNPPPDVIKGDDYNPHEFKKSQVKLYLETNEALINKTAVQSSISEALERYHADGAKSKDKKYLLDLVDSLNGKDSPGIRQIKEKLGIEEITVDNIKELGPKLSIAIMKNYPSNFDKNGNKLEPSVIKANGGIPVAEKDLNKVAASLLKSGERSPALKTANERLDNEHRQYALNLSRALLLNKDLNDGLMGVLRDEFPIKAAAQGEEIMTIGDMVLDRKTCKALFGTADFNEIKERLSIREDENGNPIISYSVKGTGDYIPIAYIDIRQKGVGYAGPPSFNMGVDRRFADKLAGAQEVLKQKQESIKYLGNILSETKQNTLSHHWAKAEENYPVDQFIREINEGSLN